VVALGSGPERCATGEEELEFDEEEEEEDKEHFGACCLRQAIPTAFDLKTVLEIQLAVFSIAFLLSSSCCTLSMLSCFKLASITSSAFGGTSNFRPKRIAILQKFRSSSLLPVVTVVVVVVVVEVVVVVAVVVVVVLVVVLVAVVIEVVVVVVEVAEVVVVVAVVFRGTR